MTISLSDRIAQDPAVQEAERDLHTATAQAASAARLIAHLERHGAGGALYFDALRSASDAYGGRSHAEGKLATAKGEALYRLLGLPIPISSAGDDTP